MKGEKSFNRVKDYEFFCRNLIIVGEVLGRVRQLYLTRGSIHKRCQAEGELRSFDITK
jgi:hypothetical protein